MITRIKICCIRDIREAETAIRHGASAIGLVAAMPSGVRTNGRLDGEKLEKFISEVRSAVRSGN